MPIVGTAGHVDHGKSTLVRALTGIDPDRLAEEKRRGMTIDLGFAHMQLPGLGEVGVVDVPGHARFLPNMLAGVHGLDAVLLVVAADEGVMPQTREHLDIIGLLGVRRLVVALTKVDLVDAPTADAVETAVTAELTRREMTGEVVRVVAAEGRGVEATRRALAAVLTEAATRNATGAGAGVAERPRLPIDRAFVMAGFGPVVTGSLIDGRLRVGQEVELVPSGTAHPLRARIRGLQQHGQQVTEAAPGSRVAVNLQGVERADIARGQVLAPPGALAAASRVDLRLRVLAGVDAALAHNARVAVFSGTAETAGRVVVLEGDELAAGAEGWVQLRLASPLALRAGDVVVLRRPSPPSTIAGGIAVDVDPAAHRRNRPEVIAALERRRAGEHEVVRVGTQEFEADRWRALEASIVRAVGAFLRANPSRAAMPRTELRTPSGMLRRAFGAALDAVVAAGGLAPHGDAVTLPGWTSKLNAAQAAAVERVLARLAEAPLSPPRTGDLQADGLDDDTRRYLEEQGLAVRLAPDLLMLPNALADAESHLRAHLRAHGTITVAEARDILGSSRKTVVPMLEYFDTTRLTRRDGDIRVLHE